LYFTLSAEVGDKCVFVWHSCEYSVHSILLKLHLPVLSITITEKGKEFRSEENAREDADVEMNSPEDNAMQEGTGNKEDDGEEKSGRENLGEGNTVGDDNGQVDKNAGERSSENKDSSDSPEKSDDEERGKKPRRVNVRTRFVTNSMYILVTCHMQLQPQIYPSDYQSCHRSFTLNSH